jgi:hypothetical protein
LTVEGAGRSIEERIAREFGRGRLPNDYASDE